MTKDMEELKKMLVFCAKKLVGQTIRINWVHPVIINSWGETYLDERGVINFDIDPSQSILGIYQTVLHEICHCLCGHVEQLDPRDWDPWFKAEYVKRQGVFRMGPKEMKEYLRSPDEAAANTLANELDRVIRARSMREFGNVDPESLIITMSQIQFQGGSDERASSTDQK